MVDRSQLSYYQALLEAGIYIYQFPKPFVLHSKLVLADPGTGRAGPEETQQGIRLKSHPLAACGSSTLDRRSFGLNYASTLLLSQGDWIPEVNELAANYRAGSHELTLEEWNKRGFFRRYIDNVMRLTSALQ